MYTLYSFPGGYGVRSLSPFAWKAEALLRRAGVPYQVEYVKNLSQFPKGKVPVLKTPEGKLIADSSDIYRYLERMYGLNLDKNLTNEQKAIGQAFKRMAEEHLYWGNVHARMINPEGEVLLRKILLAGMAPEMIEKNILSMRDAARDALYHQGLGRHSSNELYLRCCEDIEAIALYLGNSKMFFFGNEITSIDFTLAPLLTSLFANDTLFTTPLTATLHRHMSLVIYVERFDQEIFGS